MIIGQATYLALIDAPTNNIVEKLRTNCKLNCYLNKVELCQKYLEFKQPASKREIKDNLGHGIMAIDSCVTALYFALQYRNKSFNAMLTDIFSLGGDTDTIAAMAGGIWGAFNGDAELKQFAEKVENSHLIEGVAIGLYTNYEKSVKADFNS
jgi:poly(ADP-ribose) glycohydrolase ARH3